MPNTWSNVRSGVRDVDALLEDARWATSSLTFSFPTAPSQYSGYGPGEEPSDNFQAFNPTQQLRVGQILDEISSVTLLQFTKVSGGAGDLRYGMSDDADAAHAYTPVSAEWGGDSWYNNSSRWYDDPRPGNYGYHALLHETGHAVGLKHPHETHQFGRMSSEHDWMAYTVMSYRSYERQSLDGGYTNEDNGYPQSLMMYDIAALQHMYGARFDIVPEDSVYSWNATTGQMSVNGVGGASAGANHVFRTLWDGGGNDTYDLSDYTTDVRINLEPGEWSLFSSAQLPSLSGPIRPPGNVANALLHRGDERSLIENAIGGSGFDEIRGNDADNRLDGGPGGDKMIGGAGDDLYIVDHARDLIWYESHSPGHGGIDTVISSVSFSMTTAYVENLTLTGDAPLRAIGNGFANTIRGNDAANLISGRGGGDLLIGGGGNDRYQLSDRGDRVVERAGAGFDTIEAATDYRLPAHVENLRLGSGGTVGIGNELGNRIEGNWNSNRLDGRAGGDVLVGQSGDDSYVVDNARDRVIERADGGTDTVLSSVGYVLSSHVEALRLTGRAANGGAGNDLANSLTGNGAQNRLNGRLGDDQLFGGWGNDELIGGDGRDSFCFDKGLSRLNNVDDILDFVRADDTIRLDCSVFTEVGVGRLDDTAFHRGTVADDAADRILYDQASGKLFYDADGSGAGAAMLFAAITPGTWISQNDFIGY